MAVFYCHSVKCLNNLRVKNWFYRPSDKHISYVTLAECFCSPKSLETRWQRPEEQLQKLTQNLIDTSRRRLALWTDNYLLFWHEREHSYTHSWHHWQRTSSQHLPLKHTLRESSQPVETCGAMHKRYRVTKCLERRVLNVLKRRVLKMNTKLVSA